MKKTKSAIAILKNGKELFLKYGIRKVTVEDICKKAEVSKMTFYRSFENKYEVARIMLFEYARESYAVFHELFSREVPFPEILEEFLIIKKEQASAVSMEFLRDLYIDNEFMTSLKVLLEDSQKEIMAVVFQSFERARREGWIKKEISTSFILYMMEKIGHMAEDEQLLSIFKDPEEMTEVLTSYMFAGLLNDKPDK